MQGFLRDPGKLDKLREIIQNLRGEEKAKLN
jgi:hypothetical protein